MNRSRSSLIALVLAATWAASLQAAPTLTLLPSGNVFGPPGSTVGWGFTITNNMNYIEITSAQFCDNPVNFPINCIPPSTGTFIDYISQYNDIIVGPPDGVVTSVVTQQFDPVALTGVGAFQINPATFPNDVGEIVLTYNEYDADPLVGPYNTIGSDLVLSAPASVQAPEPGTAALAAIALTGFAAAMRRRAKQGRHRPGESLPAAG